MALNAFLIDPMYICLADGRCGPNSSDVSTIAHLILSIRPVRRSAASSPPYTFCYYQHWVWTPTIHPLHPIQHSYFQFPASLEQVTHHAEPSLSSPQRIPALSALVSCLRPRKFCPLAMSALVLAASSPHLVVSRQVYAVLNRCREQKSRQVRLTRRVFLGLSFSRCDMTTFHSS